MKTRSSPPRPPFSARARAWPVVLLGLASLLTVAVLLAAGREAHK